MTGSHSRSRKASTRVVPIPCLKDNYAYLVICAATGDAIVVDPSEALPVERVVERAVEREGARLVRILCTHHHWDHVGGNDALSAKFRVPVVASRYDEARVPACSIGVHEGDVIPFGAQRVRVLAVPGHTLGAVAYVLEAGTGGTRDTATQVATDVFTGDTMFLAGCGRLFEGSPTQMHASLQKLARLGDEVLVWPGHEYTVSNLRFAHHVEGPTPAIARRLRVTELQRSAGEPTVPGTMGEERRTNPFLRVSADSVRAHVDADSADDDIKVFAKLRAEKDGFRA